MPSTSAIDSEMKSILVVRFLPYFRPGSKSLSPAGELSAADWKSAEKLKPNWPSTISGDDGGAGDEQQRLDDLHPGGALHPADEHVGDHDAADERDDEVLRRLALDAEEQRDQATGTGHLGQQVEERHGDHRDRGGDAHRALPEAVGQHVGHREAAGVAHQLGDEQERDEPGDEEADRVQEAVVALQGDGAGDAEEARGREVVAGDGDAVLAAGEGAGGGVVLLGGLLAGRDPDDDGEGDDDERGEDRDVQRRGADRGRLGEGEGEGHGQFSFERGGGRGHLGGGGLGHAGRARGWPSGRR